MAALLLCKSVTTDKDGKEQITTTPGMPEAVPAGDQGRDQHDQSQDHGAVSRHRRERPGPHAAVAAGFEVCAGAAEMTTHAWFAAFVVVNLLDAALTL